MTSLGQLARVELQLVMQGCDQRTLIALARCSRSTFAAADHPFAWRSLPPLQLQCPSPRDLPAQLIARLNVRRAGGDRADEAHRGTAGLRKEAVCHSPPALVLILAPFICSCRSFLASQPVKSAPPLSSIIVELALTSTAPE